MDAAKECAFPFSKRLPMKTLTLTLALALASSLALHVFADPPVFHTPSVPEGWMVVRGEADPGAVRSAKPAVPLVLATRGLVSLPMEATFRFRAAQGDSVTVSLLEEMPDAKNAATAKPLLTATFRPTAASAAMVTVQAGGEAMSTGIPSMRGYSAQKKHVGSLIYSWRFPKVKNLWDEADRKEIGAAYAKLVPFEEKTFVLRLSITLTSRQIWLDDRLVAETPVSSPADAFFSLQLTKSAQMLSFDYRSLTAEESSRFLPLQLAHYSHARTAQTEGNDAVLALLGGLPVWMPQAPLVNINLGDSLYRFRATNGGGPNASYVNAQHAWPGAFDVDPASLTFRVPYRTYQNAWLLAWLDDAPNAVPKGAFRFFRASAGYPASSDFEITEDAMASGLVERLPDKTSEGKALYIVRVPLNSADFYGFRDMAGDYLEFELTKPLALGRSYPDPIYYGYHPAGLPSSIHVVGITLEEAPFSYEVKPKQTGFVFEQPEKPSIAVAVTNTSDRLLVTKVSVNTKSYDATEARALSQTIAIGPGETQEAQFEFDLKKLGWHELNAEVEATENRRENRHNQLSLVLLPPNTRTYGDAPNEVRFGTWNLLGHYTPLSTDKEENEPILAMFRKLGLRKIALHESFFTTEMLKKHNFLPTGPHTMLRGSWKEGDPAAQNDAAAKEASWLDKASELTTSPSYFYGGEWHIGRLAQYAPWPFYTGDGDRDLNDEERESVTAHLPIFTAIGQAIREKYPHARRYLQWGSPIGTIAYMRAGLSKEVVDGYGMDAPMFELLPESSNATGSINQLWMLRQEAQRLGWPQLPIHWCEGPFFPTNPGALTEAEQMNYQVRYLLVGIGYGVESFEAGIVPHDAGNYYGAEHYGAGVFHRVPLMNPKPAVAAIATMTSMLCGADVAGPVETGSLTAYGMGFRRVRDGAKIFALWRVTGTSVAQMKVRGTDPTLTDSMGNATKLAAKDGVIAVPISATPVWLTGVEKIEEFRAGAPLYDSAPANITRPLAEMSDKAWTYDGSEDKAYAYNHFSVRRIPDPELKAEFGPGEEGHPVAVAITLPVEPGDRPLATRYGALRPKKPIAIPGKPSALGLWVKGNSSWGRVIYQVRDAKGELWTATGTKDDWNCDDTHGWSSVNFEGWRYLRFPLPGTAPWDNARELETTWWGSRGGDGVVDLPLSVEKIIVEARNEVPVLGVMTTVLERSYKLSQLVAEYDSEENTTPAVIAKSKLRMPAAVWAGPVDNTLARLSAEGTGAAPELREFTEPPHFNDGRRMTIHFDETPGLKYNLYLSIYPDGRGADLLKAGVKSEEVVTGLKPEVPMYLFLTSGGADNKESKPSKPVKLITHDNFAEK